MRRGRDIRPTGHGGAWRHAVKDLASCALVSRLSGTQHLSESAFRLRAAPELHDDTHSDSERILDAVSRRRALYHRESAVSTARNGSMRLQIAILELDQLAARSRGPRRRQRLLGEERCFLACSVCLCHFSSWSLGLDHHRLSFSGAMHASIAALLSLCVAATLALVPTELYEMNIRRQQRNRYGKRQVVASTSQAPSSPSSNVVVGSFNNCPAIAPAELFGADYEPGWRTYGYCACPYVAWLIEQTSPAPTTWRHLPSTPSNATMPWMARSLPASSRTAPATAPARSPLPPTCVSAVES